MADARIHLITSDDPERPPMGAGAALPADVQELRVAPEILAALDRIAAAFESVAAILAPAERPAEDDDDRCWASIWTGRAAGVPQVCTRPAGHGPGHVARDEDGNVLACTLGIPPTVPEGWVCPACGQGAAVGS
ncbi:hypothetical protein [Promicromonospora sp. NPDC050880]|uniref:hypothetical protein n=1 Tax=Promicromonospora sp. NPDC050880 TaxID=3364406 RepID=UPI0037A5388F